MRIVAFGKPIFAVMAARKFEDNDGRTFYEHDPISFLISREAIRMC